MPQRIIERLEQLGYSQSENPIQQISCVQRLFAQLFEFENLDVLLKNEEPITEQFLLDKMVNAERGGLCYELNGLLHIVLRKLSFNVSLAAATVWTGQEWGLDRTHTINLFEYKENLYLIDSGSGNNLALAPLALDGRTITSPSGSYRLRSQKTEKGSMLCERWSEEGWTKHCAFEPDIVGWKDLNRVKELIHTHPDSPFNKTMLVAKTVEDGTFSINKERFSRKWMDGRTKTIRFDRRSDLLEQVKLHAAPGVYDAAVELS